MKKETCKHFWLPNEVIILPKHKGEHVGADKKYMLCDVLKVRRVYCAKCGKNCYSDLSDLE